MGAAVCAAAQGVTGFHMGKFDMDELVPEDASSVAATVAKCATPHFLLCSTCSEQGPQHAPCPECTQGGCADQQHEQRLHGSI